MAEPPAAPRVLVAATSLPGAPSPVPDAAALAVALAAESGAPVVVIEVDGPGRRRPTLLASAAARARESELRSLGAAARGSLCWIACEADAWDGARAAAAAPGASAIVAILPPGVWRDVVDSAPPELAGALVRASLPAHRAIVSLAVRDLSHRGVLVRVPPRPMGMVHSRRAIAGLDPGGDVARRSGRFARALLRRGARRLADERGQALPAVLGLALITIIVGGGLAILGAAATAGGRLQRAADLAAISAARSLRDDHARLFLPARLPSGAPNPAHLTDAEYRDGARAAAAEAAARNGASEADLSVGFPGSGFAPTRVRVTLAGEPSVGDDDPGGGEREVVATATAEAYPLAAPAAPAPGAVTAGTGGGYSGPLVERQGERMRPDAGAAFDGLATAAANDGHALVVNSAFRSDAEQAALFAANPDPRWVAPPGTSLHRCATELDLGPATAYAWLAANAERFGFLRRYAWEPWHFGFVAGPAPCSAAGNRVAGGPDGGFAGVALPAFVPGRFRQAIAAAASRWNVSPAVLAAQLMAESNFNPFAVSPAGAQGIAQFMPATAAAYGLADPFDAAGAIQTQARLMSDLLRQFGSVELALAAYNAGPGAVAACRCVPPYPETRAYVARILGLLGGVGATTPPALEVRLVE